MKFLKGISFFLLNILIFVSGAWIGIIGQNFFYPGIRASYPDTENAIVIDNPAEVISQKRCINADTRYKIIEQRDTEYITTYYQTLPVQYLGMNRDEFVQVMKQYNLSPPLCELEKGFLSLEITSFSPNEVTIHKRYKSVEEEESFLLVVENHYIVIYTEERMEKYDLTTIYVPSLPEQLKQELLSGKVIHGKKQLYDFLESYTS